MNLYDFPPIAAALDAASHFVTGLASALEPLAGGASAAQLAALNRFGFDLGLAFQIVDDVLDETGTAESLGKTPGKDRKAAKMAYVALEGLAGAAGPQVRRASRRDVGGAPDGGQAEPQAGGWGRGRCLLRRCGCVGHGSIMPRAGVPRRGPPW